jgi:hypothetical protein
LYHVLAGLPEASGSDQQRDYKTHSNSPLRFSSRSRRTVIFASMSIDARLRAIPSRVNMSAVTAFTLPDARATQQDATGSLTTILILVSDH